MYYYKAYGLIIESPIFFPELEELEVLASVDAHFHLAPPPQWVLTQYQEGRFAFLDDKVMWFRLNDDLLIYVENGTDVYIYRINANLSEAVMRSYILTGALTFLMLQHEYTLIHGSALMYDGKVTIISGPSGSGKSTTSLELINIHHFSFVSDDICAVKYIDNKCIIYPGPPWQKLCADVSSLHPDIEYTFLEETGGKYAHKMINNYVSSPQIVDRLFIINKHNQLALHEVTGVNKIHTLSHNIFRGEIISELGSAPKRISQLFQIASAIKIYIIERPYSVDTLDTICSMIKSNLTSNNTDRFIV